VTVDREQIRTSASDLKESLSLLSQTTADVIDMLLGELEQAEGKIEQLVNHRDWLLGEHEANEQAPMDEHAQATIARYAERAEQAEQDGPADEDAA